MNIIEIHNIDDPALAPYVSLTEAQLRSRLDPAEALFVAESPKVIEVALRAGFVPQSLLCERRHIDGDAAAIIVACPPGMPVYTGSRQLLASLTGYTLTRGVLCAMHRPEPPSLDSVCATARRLLVIDAVVDTTNIGAMFRSAAALGFDGVLLTPSSCDPFNRRSIRVSMGSVFLIPWTWVGDDLTDLHHFGFRTVAMALRNDSVAIDDPILEAAPRLAVVMGSEGYGLSEKTIADADYVARIPMAYGVDSLNVGAAAAIAMWQLRKK